MRVAYVLLNFARRTPVYIARTRWRLDSPQPILLFFIGDKNARFDSRYLSETMRMTFDADDSESSGFDSVPPWRMEAHDLDDLECSLRYLEREDRRAWDHVQLLLSELREEV